MRLNDGRTPPHTAGAAMERSGGRREIAACIEAENQ
jgi:hypothetical protein